MKSTWVVRFTRNAILLLVPVAIVWTLMTPFYNRFLTIGTENLVRLTEWPSVTRLLAHEDHHFLITRTDHSTARGALSSVRVTDTHFPLILLVAFFLAVPDLSWRDRFSNLAWATLFCVFFHLFSLLCWVKFVYATQLGEWSLEHYNSFQRNFWGLTKHLLDIPFKLAMPLLLWAGFYVKELLPPSPSHKA